MFRLRIYTTIKTAFNNINSKDTSNKIHVIKKIKKLSNKIKKRSPPEASSLHGL